MNFVPVFAAVGVVYHEAGTYIYAKTVFFMI